MSAAKLYRQLTKDEQHELELSVIKQRCEEVSVRGFLFFARYMYKNVHGRRFRVDKNIEQAAAELIKLIKGEIFNLVINYPPRAGKTELFVKILLAWTYVLNRNSCNMHLSFSDSLIADNSECAKSFIRSEAFQELWPIEFKKDSVMEWNFVDGGTTYCASTGGQVTGRGAGAEQPEPPKYEDIENVFELETIRRKKQQEKYFQGAYFDYMKANNLDVYQDPVFSGLMIIDDPMKPKDALSDVTRNKVNNLWPNTLMSRRNAGDRTPVIVIMQRIHDMDFTGFLVKESGENWTVVVIAAAIIGPDGTVKTSNFKKFSVKFLENMRREFPYIFNGQFQQQPVPDDGHYYKRQDQQGRWLEQYYDIDRFDLSLLTKYITGDFAVTEDGGDYTALAVWGVDCNRDIYLIDLWYGQTGPEEWISRLYDLAKKHKCHDFTGETGPIKRATEASIQEGAMKYSWPLNLSWVSHTVAGGKPVAARAFQALWNSRRVLLPCDRQGAPLPFVDDTSRCGGFMPQVLKFPLGSYDDIADTASIFGRRISEVWQGATPEASEPDRITDYDDFSDFEGETWRTLT